MATKTTTDPALVAVVTAMLAGRDLEPVLAHVLSGDDEQVADFAFRDRTRVKAAARVAAKLIQPVRALRGQGTGPASTWVRRTSPARQAAFILASARRMAKREGATDLDAERRYAAQHLAAERARFEAAARVDEDERRYGPVLGWHSRQDELVDPVCARLHGGNFRAHRPPVVDGWPAYPGTLHGGACRCVSSRPFPQGKLIGAPDV